LFGAAAFVLVALMVVNQWKKLFGRRPPLDEQLSILDKSLRKDMRAGDAAVEKQIESLRVEVGGKFDELAETREVHSLQIARSFEGISKKLDEQTSVLTVSAEKRTEATNEKISDLRVAIGKLDERTKKL
jgi:hypothetical protein